MTNKKENLINFVNVSKEYQNQTVLKKLNLQIKSGEFLVLVGSSGSGKSTTLKMINRLVELTSGNVLIDNQDIDSFDLKKLRLSIGYVSQQNTLFPNLNVEENLGLVLELNKIDKSQHHDKIIELLKLVNLPEDYLQKMPNQLSGGEKQRINILRSIAADQKIILMDEPFNALDPILRKQLQDWIKHLHKKLKTTIVFVTHDIDEALYLADRIALINNGQLIQIDIPNQILKNPKTKFVENFFERRGVI